MRKGESDTSKKVCIIHNGCPGRALDSSRILKYFEANNCVIVENPKKADYMVFFTCSFQRSQEEGSFRLIRKLRRYKGELIVSGCLPLIAQERFQREFNGRFFEGKNLEEIENIFPDFKIRLREIPDANFGQHRLISPLSLTVRFIGLYCNKFVSRKNLIKKIYNRVVNLISKHSIVNIVHKIEGRKKTACYLRISSGCLGNCSYCGIKKAIGNLKSKPPDIILREYEGLLRNAHNLFAIVGDDVGAYGLDIGSSFAALFDTLTRGSRKKSVRPGWYLHHFHPNWVIKYQDALLRYIGEGCIRGILSPIQSGSARIAQLMNRYSHIEKIVDAFLTFRKVDPALKLNTQIIIGFPSESNEDFFKTLEVLKRIRFDYVTIYPYHDIPGSLAFGMTSKIDVSLIKERIKLTIDFLDKERLFYLCDDENIVK